MPIRIENNIPIPPVNRGRVAAAQSKYPFARMQPGQSAGYVLPAQRKAAIRTMACVRNAIARVSDPTAKFTTRSMIENGKPVFRVWRVGTPINGGS